MKSINFIHFDLGEMYSMIFNLEIKNKWKKSPLRISLTCHINTSCVTSSSMQKQKLRLVFFTLFVMQFKFDHL